MSPERVEETEKKVSRPKKRTKAVDLEIAEKNIIARTGQAPEHIEEKLLSSMTASDIGAQTLEYLSDIERRVIGFREA